jgi:hypothetical protein
MKYLFLIIAICIVVATFSFATNTNAALIRGSGGRVITTYTPGVTCPGVGPITISPSRFYIPAYPYYLTPTSQFFAGGRTPTAGKNWLASYPSNPVPICFTDTPVPVPVPVFTILRYGVSK